MRWDVEFEAFVREHTNALYRAAFVLTGEGHRAADLVQETLTHLYPKWDRVLSTDTPIAYVRRALVNMFLSEARTQRGHDLLFADIPDRAAATTDHGLDRVMVSGLLAGLVPRQRSAVTLHFLYDLSDRAAAFAMGCSTPAFRGHLRRGIAAMRTELLVDRGPASGTDSAWSES